MTTSKQFSCADCGALMAQDTGICITCDNHYRALERAMDEHNRIARADRRCGCNAKLPADRDVCDSCAPYADH